MSKPESKLEFKSKIASESTKIACSESTAEKSTCDAAQICDPTKSPKPGQEDPWDNVHWGSCCADT